MNAHDIKQKKTNELFEKLGVFWAFSKEQFEKNKTPLKDGEKYIDIGAGGFMPRGNYDALIAGLKEIKNEFKEAMKDQDARIKHIRYQLNNHEAYYTGSIEDTLDALGEDFTREEVLAVFDGRHKKTVTAQ